MEEQNNNNMINQPAEDTIILKGKFRFTNDSVFGIFAILIDIKTEKLCYYNIFASFFSDLYNIDIDLPWNILNQTFTKLQMSGNFAQTVTQDLQRTFDEKLSYENNLISIILHDIKRDRKNKILQTLEMIFSAANRGKQFQIDYRIEKVNLEYVLKNKKNITEQEEKKEEETINLNNSIKIDPSLFSVPAHPVVTPFGKNEAAGKLKSGDQILMLIEQKSSYGQHWLETFGAFEENGKTPLPVIGHVAQIAYGSKGSVDIMVMYTPSQYTKFNIEPRVRIKLFDPEIDHNAINPYDFEFPEEQIFTPATIQSLLKEKNFLSLLITALVCFFVAICAFFLI